MSLLLQSGRKLSLQFARRPLYGRSTYSNSHTAINITNHTAHGIRQQELLLAIVEALPTTRAQVTPTASIAFHMYNVYCLGSAVEQK